MSLRIAAASILRGTARPSRADRGIYAGRRVNFGNKVTEPKSGHTGGAKRTHRRWLPNVQTKRVQSEVLGRELKIKFTTHALRCVDKAGGFDNYILNTKDTKLDSALAVSLKREMLATLAEAESSVGGSGGGAGETVAVAVEPERTEAIETDTPTNPTDTGR
eukprot:m.446475 g.446475  ORF g.446475 m.446475 type:complete len:162 (+) comp19366_c0_seq1:235-720(+)